MSELYHHGVKGQKWGERNAEWYPIDRYMKAKGIKKKKELLGRVGVTASTKEVRSNNPIPTEDRVYQKGYRVNHVSGVPFKKLTDRPLYVAADSSDKDLYETFLSLNLNKKGYTPSMITFELTKDLKVPSDQKQKEIYDSIPGKKPEYKEFIKHLDVNSDPIVKTFYSKMREEGYDGVLDTHDITGSWMQAKAPIIVLDTIGSLSDMKVSDIKQEDIVAAFERYKQSQA